MADSVLIAHADTGKVGRQELALLPAPTGTETHKVIPHIEVVNAIIEALGFRHIAVLAGDNPATFLARHVVGDWGDVDEDDRAENELSVREGFRVLSAYHLRDGTRIWIITEADRSSTTILLPSEY